MNFKTSMNNAKTVHTEIIAQVTVRSACNMCIIRRMRQYHENMIVFIWQIVIIVNMHINCLLYTSDAADE